MGQSVEINPEYVRQKKGSLKKDYRSQKHKITKARWFNLGYYYASTVLVTGITFATIVSAPDQIVSDEFRDKRNKIGLALVTGAFIGFGVRHKLLGKDQDALKSRHVQELEQLENQLVKSQSRHVKPVEQHAENAKEIAPVADLRSTLADDVADDKVKKLPTPATRQPPKLDQQAS